MSYRIGSDGRTYTEEGVAVTYLWQEPAAAAAFEPRYVGEFFINVSANGRHRLLVKEVCLNQPCEFVGEDVVDHIIGYVGIFHYNFR